MIKYKIKDTNSGLFSMGGHTPRFTKEGKMWNKLSNLEKHLNYFKAIPETWVIVEIDLIERPVACRAKDCHKPRGSAMLGPGFWHIPIHLVKGSPEWTKYVTAKMSGKHVD